MVGNLYCNFDAVLDGQQALRLFGLVQPKFGEVEPQEHRRAVTELALVNLESLLLGGERVDLVACDHLVGLDQ